MIENANSSELAFNITWSRLAPMLLAWSGSFPPSPCSRIPNPTTPWDEMTGVAKDSISNIEDSSLRDTALVVKGNFVELFEIALYGWLVAFARHLDLQDARNPLEQTLNDEKKADATLTQIGDQVLNPRAAKARPPDDRRRAGYARSLRG
jgi:hypothetical protein